MAESFVAVLRLQEIPVKRDYVWRSQGRVLVPANATRGTLHSMFPVAESPHFTPA